MKNAQGDATGIWVDEKALSNNTLYVTSLSNPQMKCTINANGISEVLEIESVPSPFSYDSEIETKDKKLTLLIQYDVKEKGTKLGIRREGENDEIVTLVPNAKEGKGGIIFSREGKLPNIGKVELDCEYYSP
jgi:hypothetical protein